MTIMRNAWFILKRIKPGLILFLCMLISWGMSGCTKKEPVKAERIVNVKIQVAEIKAFRPFIQAIGTLKPYEEVIASSQVEGILKRTYADEGTPLSLGSVLALIDETDIRLEVARDEAVLRQAQATLANSKIEYKRKEALYKEQLVTQQQFDDISTRMALAEADVDRAKAVLSLGREKLAKTKITSPLHGVVKEKKVTMGDYIRNGTPLFTIIKIDPLKLYFNVAEKDVAKIKIGQQIQFKVDPIPDKEFSAKVSIVNPNLEEKTRTLQVEAVAANRESRLKPGLFSRVVLYTGEPRKMIVVPITSILYDEDRMRVFVVEGGRAKEKFIKTGSKYGELIEITEGLSAGEKVVVVGQNNLSEGIKVNVAR